MRQRLSLKPWWSGHEVGSGAKDTATAWMSAGLLMMPRGGRGVSVVSAQTLNSAVAAALRSCSIEIERLSVIVAEAELRQATEAGEIDRNRHTKASTGPGALRPVAPTRDCELERVEASALTNRLCHERTYFPTIAGCYERLGARATVVGERLSRNHPPS